MSRSKQKGTSWESAIIHYLNSFGFDCERRALSGAMDRGDISGVRGVVIEAKNVRANELASWVDEAEVERLNDDAPYGVVWAHRRGKASPGDGYVTMSGRMFIEFLKAGGWLD